MGAGSWHIGGKMTCKVGVVHHTTRDVTGLVKATKASIVSTDDGTLGPGFNHRAVWSALLEHHNSADFLCVLEDDAVPVQGFLSQLDRALEVAPSPIVSLYLGRANPIHWQPFIDLSLKEAQKTNSCWLVADELLHAVGVAIKTDLVSDMLEQSNQRLSIDESIGDWARTAGHRISYSIPSLLDHMDGPTLIQHPDGDTRTPGRVAWWTDTRNTWTDKAINMKQPMVPAP